jgi:Putative amidase domain
MKNLFLIIASLTSCVSASARPQEPYTPILAVNYANSWTDNMLTLRNPAYISFSNDCTNFLSQTLRAGGWRNTTVGSSTSDLYWYYVSGTQYSQTWSVANSLFRRFYNGYEGWYGGQVFNPNTMTANPGDIIFTDWTGDGIIDHSMIITTGGSYSAITLSYHSTDRKNRPWGTIVSTNPSAIYYKYSKFSF